MNRNDINGNGITNMNNINSNNKNNNSRSRTHSNSSRHTGLSGISGLSGINGINSINAVIFIIAPHGNHNINHNINSHNNEAPAVRKIQTQFGGMSRISENHSKQSPATDHEDTDDMNHGLLQTLIDLSCWSWWGCWWNGY